MHDPPHYEGQSQTHQQDHEVHLADGDFVGRDRPLTPSHLEPPSAGPALSDAGSSSGLSQSKSVEFDLPPPISPSRPRSPWALFDPYSNNKVKKKRSLSKPGW